jgi:HK97 family phage portal protein
MLTAHCLLRGNAYAYIKTDGKGAVVELIPLDPDKMTIEISVNYNGPAWYHYLDQNNKPITFPAGNILHLKTLSRDGIKGMSIIEQAREAIGLSLAAEEHGSRILSNGAAIRGILQTDGTLNDSAYERLKKRFSEVYSGLHNAGKVAILESGMKWQNIGMTSKDAEFLDLRRFQVADIARVFRVPPHLAGDLDKATFSNIEQQSLEFVQFCMLPWFTKWEEALSRDLFWPSDRGQYYVEVLVDNLVRGDIKTRYEAYSVGRNNGWLSVNEIRERENLNRIGPEGDIRLAPLNMIPLEQVGKTSEPVEPEPVPNGPVDVPRYDPAAMDIMVDDVAKRVAAKAISVLRKTVRMHRSSQNGLLDVQMEISSCVKDIFLPLAALFGVEQSQEMALSLTACSIQPSIYNLLMERSAVDEKDASHWLEKTADDWTEFLPGQIISRIQPLLGRNYGKN